MSVLVFREVEVGDGGHSGSGDRGVGNGGGR